MFIRGNKFNRLFRGISILTCKRMFVVRMNSFWDFCDKEILCWGHCICEHSCNYVRLCECPIVRRQSRSMKLCFRVLILISSSLSLLLLEVEAALTLWDWQPFKNGWKLSVESVYILPLQNILCSNLYYLQTYSVQTLIICKHTLFKPSLSANILCSNHYLQTYVLFKLSLSANILCSNLYYLQTYSVQTSLFANIFCSNLYYLQTYSVQTSLSANILCSNLYYLQTYSVQTLIICKHTLFKPSLSANILCSNLYYLQTYSVQTLIICKHTLFKPLFSANILCSNLIIMYLCSNPHYLQTYSVQTSLSANILWSNLYYPKILCLDLIYLQTYSVQTLMICKHTLIKPHYLQTYSVQTFIMYKNSVQILNLQIYFIQSIIIMQSSLCSNQDERNEE